MKGRFLSGPICVICGCLIPVMARPPRITKSHYELLAALRHALRHFLSFSQNAARDAGLTAQQHQALLALKGFPGRDYTSVSELAERLQLRHHSTVGLVDRLVRRRLLRRTPSRRDRRRVELRLTAGGEKLIERLSAVHLAELRQRGKELHRLIASITGE
jgi:DNA-binding MarR family transcriptional regulator